jgi:serine/threonine protein kinase/Flp pilus assembly protein TadD
MHASGTAGPASADAALGRLVDELAARVRAGEAVDPGAVAREHPGYAEELRGLLPALALLADASHPAGDSTGPAQAAPAGDELTPGVLGDFRIFREVGRGGMGVVYEAEQISLTRRVALKVLPFAATLDAKQLQRFKNEARAAAGLRHEHIVHVYGVGCERGVHYYAMEFIDGLTLAQLIAGMRGDGGKEKAAGPTRTAPYHPADRSASFGAGLGAAEPGSQTPATEDPATKPPAADTAPVAALSTQHSGPRGHEFYRTAARLIAQAADALEHAHSFGIVHRDVKPGNLLVDQAGKVWVADFGLARFGPDAGLTMSGDLLGTLRYMAPEQALARHGLVDHRADVYGLGATLYELLTGRPAVDATDRADVLRQIAFEDPIPPRTLDRVIPAELETVTLKALAKNPNERYATAGELADDLRRWLEHKTIRAKPPTLKQRAAKWALRHKPLAWAAVAVVAVVMAALAAVAGYAWYKNGQLQTAYSAMAQARADERVQRDLAENGLKLAWQATDDMYEYFVCQWVYESPVTLDAEKRAFLRRALTVNRALIQAGAANPVLAPQVILAHIQVEDICRILGEPRPRLEPLLRQLIQEVERLPEGAVDPTQRRRVLVVAYARLCYEQRHNTNRAEAEVMVRRGLELGPVVDDADHPGARYQDRWADLHTRLGDLLLGSGRRDEAEQLYLRVRQLREEGLLRKPYGFGMPPLLACADKLATFHLDRGDSQAVRELYQRALRVCAEAVAKKPGDPDLREGFARCHQSVGDTMARAGDFAEAEQAFRKAVALREKLATDYPSEASYAVALASTYGHLSRVLNSQGRPQEAEAIFRQAIALHEQTLEKCKAKLGPDLPAALKGMNILADSYADLGRHGEALKLREEMLALQKARLGPDDNDTLALMNNLALAYQGVGRLPEAVALLEQTLEKCKAIFSPDDKGTLTCMGNLAVAYQGVGRLMEAVALLEQALERWKAKFGPDDNRTLGCMGNLADAYYDVGQFDRAEPLLVDLLERRRKADGPKSPATAGVLALLGKNRLKQHKYAEAEPVLRECLAIRAEKLPDDWSRFNALSMLGGALLGQKKYAEAEPLLLQGYEGMKQREATIPPPGKARLTEATERLVRLYEATGRADEARAWRAKLPPAPRANRAP